jgi:glycine reductase complex component B subunit gamma
MNIREEIMEKIRVVHYVNQFFGQIGGEDKAGIPPQMKEGPIGLGQAIQKESNDRFMIVRTIICGDNYAAEHIEEVEPIILELVKQVNPDLFIAGPAFAAGRYGMACGVMCKAVQQKLGIPTITAMNQANPGVEEARKYAYILEAGESIKDMKRVLPKMVALAQKIVDKIPLGLPQEEGYFPRGVRINVRAEKRGSRRAVDMLLKKLHGEPFVTELPLPKFDRVPPAPPIENLSKALIALVTEGGIVPKGNPDRIEAHNASKYCKYFIGNLNDLTGEDYQTAHGGYDPVFANEDPDRVLPLDASRLLEKEGVFAKLYDYYYVTVGNVTAVNSAARYGREIGELLRKEGVQGVILTST